MARLDVVERTLEADRFLLCPLLYAPCPCPPLLAVDALGLTFGGRTRSVRICLWNLVPVAARESPGISSLTWTVWACWRRLSSRENRREQWHSKGRSPVCFLAHVRTLIYTRL